MQRITQVWTSLKHKLSCSNFFGFLISTSGGFLKKYSEIFVGKSQLFRFVLKKQATEKEGESWNEKLQTRKIEREREREREECVCYSGKDTEKSLDVREGIRLEKYMEKKIEIVCSIRRESKDTEKSFDVREGIKVDKFREKENRNKGDKVLCSMSIWFLFTEATKYK